MFVATQLCHIINNWIPYYWLLEILNKNKYFIFMGVVENFATIGTLEKHSLLVLSY